MCRGRTGNVLKPRSFLEYTVARMRRRIIGTAGHIDHGKTSLVLALTGTDTDRLPEEKRRGITIDLGFASLVAGDLQLGFIDVPGHERFVRNMLAGIGGIDAALLVVAADESIKPQTREHFEILRLLGIRRAVVALTKSDLVDRDMIDLVGAEVRELLSKSAMADAPIVAVSSATRDGLDRLRNELVEAASAMPPRDAAKKVYRLPIDRVFVMQGFGTVVTGTAISGSLRSESRVAIEPGALASRARAIQVHGERRDSSLAGERTSLNLADVPADRIHRGMHVIEPGTLEPSSIVTARVELLSSAPALQDGARVRVHLHSAEMLASIRVLVAESRDIRAGESGWCQLRLEKPSIAVHGDRFILRRYSPLQTIGGGTVITSVVGNLHRSTREQLLQEWSTDDVEAQLRLLARHRGEHGASLRDLQRHNGMSLDALQELKFESKELVAFGNRERRWIDSSVLGDIRRRAMEIVREHFATKNLTTGLSRSELLQRLIRNGGDQELTNFLIADLEREKIIHLKGDTIDLPGRASGPRGVEGELAAAIEKRFADDGLQPPPVSELIKTMAQRPKVIEGVISYLVRSGALIRLADGVYIHPETVRSVASSVQRHRGESIDIAWFKAKFSLSRKIAVPLLEHLDRIAVTKRSGDQRLVL